MKKLFHPAKLIGTLTDFGAPRLPGLGCRPIMVMGDQTDSIVAANAWWAAQACSATTDESLKTTKCNE